MNKYFSGQGIVYLAKYNEDGTLGKFIDLGNVPKLDVINFGGEIKVLIAIECLTAENMELVFGKATDEVTLPDLPSPKVSTCNHLRYFEIPNKEQKNYKTFTYNSLPTDSYYLVLDGVNTADSNRRFRVDVINVKFDALKRLNIDDFELAQFELVGQVKEVNGEYGYFSIETEGLSKPDEVHTFKLGKLPFSEFINDDDIQELY